MAETKDRAIGWGEAVQNTNNGGEWEPLPEGDYTFKITKFNRGRYNGSERMPACNVAELTLYCDDGKNKGSFLHRIYMVESQVWKLSALARALGWAEPGSSECVMRWDEILGASGRCKVAIRNYQKRDGSLGKSNEVKTFYDAEFKPQKRVTPPVTDIEEGPDDLPF